MPKTKISEYDATAANNTDVNSINIAEGCAPSGINNAIRQVMADLKDFQQGTKGDPFLGPVTPSTLTLTGLAANRILYTNGSKQVSSSDNVQFDGTTVTINSLATTTFSASGIATFGVGSAGAPSITFAGDTNTGIYSPTADTIAFTEGGVESMRIDSAGNVGIGTNSPSSFGKFAVTGSIGSFYVDAGATGVAFSFNGPNYISSKGGSSGALVFETGGANERMRIDSSGNVGIGTNSPGYKLDVRNSGNASIASVTSGAASISQVHVIGTSGAQSYFWQASASFSPYHSLIAGNAGIYASTNLSYEVDGNLYQSWWTNGSERMRITSGGDVRIGATTSPQASKLFVTQTAADGYTLGLNAVSNGGSFFLLNFFAANTQTGTISSNGTTTVYGTTSDYRLKTVVGSISDAGQRIDALEPIEYDWNNGGRTRGFLAHKFAEIYPNSVSGKKDTVDKEGKPVYQTMQASSSEVMADLIAEIQSLRKRVAQLESK